MSALSGLFLFNPRMRVFEEDLAKLAQATDRLGPDGGRQIIHANAGFAFRAFYTTPESETEDQPLFSDGVMLTLDGRIDNREELATVLGGSKRPTITDVELVHAAYRKFGVNCFAKLEGDWAIALWDQSSNRLVLARDVFGVRRMFYRIDKGRLAWCTSIEPLVQTSPGPLHIDPDYIAGYLYPRPPIEATPFKEIRACVPASLMIFGIHGLEEFRMYWALDPRIRIRYSSDMEYEEHFRELFRQSVRRRLRSNVNVLAELSGGLDSSSIVCMADVVAQKEHCPPVDTLSYFNPDEPSGDERSYFTQIEKHRGRTGHHISIAEFARTSSDNPLSLLGEHFSAVPGVFARSLRWDSKIAEIQGQTNSRVILSGVGGDELLGGVQYEAPELAGSLLDGRLFSFLRSTYHWSIARRKPFFRLVHEAGRLLWASVNPDALARFDGKRLEWALVEPPDLRTSLRTFAHWRRLSPSGLTMERVRYGIAQQLTVTEPPLLGCVERRYPYLDKALFEFLSSIPRNQVLRPGMRRSLMRRALRGLVPDPILERRSKWFGTRGPLMTLRDENEVLQQMLKERWVSNGRFVNTSLLSKHIEAAQLGANDEAVPLLSVLALEQWLRSLPRHARVAIAP